MHSAPGSDTVRRNVPVRRAVWAMFAVVAVLMVLGWGMFFLVVLPAHYNMGDGTLFGVGLAFTAFTLGVRHAFDADHIAAIDNTARSLVEHGDRPPVSVGFWFALGHSTVVLAAVTLLAAGVNVLASQMVTDDSVLASVAGVWGPLVSGIFLLLIGMVNLVSVVGIWRVFRRLRGGALDEAQLETRLHGHGVMSRMVQPLMRRIDKPWKMYPLGLLFGLGFDTATTIGLFVIGTSGALSAPWYIVLVLPVLFMAGMTLCDTLDGLLMNWAYQWAYARPLRKVYYNLTVTSMSVGVAFLVATVALGGLVVQRTGAEAGPLAWLGTVDLENFGLAVVGLFILTWIGAVAYWKWGNVEGRRSVPR